MINMNFNNELSAGFTTSLLSLYYHWGEVCQLSPRELSFKLWFRLNLQHLVKICNIDRQFCFGLFDQRPWKHLESEEALTKKGTEVLQERHFYSMKIAGL